MDKKDVKVDLYEMNSESVYNTLHGDKATPDKDGGIDALTGLFYKRAFFDRAQKFIKQAQDEKEFCLVAIDIEHFKLFNEWYGTDAGDKFLADIAYRLNEACIARCGVAGYLGDDDFAIIVPNRRDLLEFLEADIIGRVREYEDSAGFMPAFGVYFIEDKDMSVSAMYDRASIALAKIRGNYGSRMNFYEPGMMLKIEEEHLLLKEVPRALFGHEFVFFLQPKCNMTSGKIIGAEALVRWKKPDGTTVPPSEFIPVLEKNGFITNLDKYIWEEVCHFLRSIIDRGVRPVPISINVSRVDIYSMDVPRFIGNLLRSYHLEPKLLEIEITESAYTEKMELINEVVNSLRKQGMSVHMDDFGSGYSSLNMLNDVNIDVLKLDMKFLSISENRMGKGLGILEAVINMARMMGTKVIVEGVETKEQVNFLLDMGCEYAQGYFFYKPVPMEEFETLLLNERKLFDYSGLQLKKNNQLHIRELMNENLFSETIVNNILGAIAFVECYGDVVEIVRTNDTYARVIMSKDGDENRHRYPMENIYYEDRELFLNIFKNAYANPLEGASGEFRYVKPDGIIVWYRIRVFFLREQDGHRMFYGSVTDIISEKQRELEINITEKKLESALRLSQINCFEWHVYNDTCSFMNISVSEAMAAAGGVFTRKYTEITGFWDKFLGYVQQKFANYEEVVEFFKAFKNGNVLEARSMDIQFSADVAKSSWLRVTCEPMVNLMGEVTHIIGAFTDVTEEIREKLLLEKKAATDELTKVYNRYGGVGLIEDYLEEMSENDTAVLMMLDLDNFKQANDVYGHSFGDKILVGLTAILRRYFREDDVICRVGGDEFIILCKGINHDTVSKKTLEIVEKISQLDGGEANYKTSCSLGYVMVPKEGRNFKELFNKADEAMYRAKKMGKNTVFEYQNT